MSFKLKVGSALRSFLMAALVFVVFFGGVSTANAWAPCTPFCDGCGAASYVQRATTFGVKSGLIQVEQAARLSELGKVAAKLTTDAAKLTATKTMGGEKLKKIVESMVQNIMIEHTVGNDVQTNAVTNTVLGVHGVLAQARMLLDMMNVDDSIGWKTTTVTGHQLSAAAKGFSDSHSYENQMLEDYMKNIKGYFDFDLPHDPKDRVAANVNTLNEHEVDPLSPMLITRLSMTDEEAAATRQMLDIMIADAPLPVTDGKNDVFELNRKIFKAKKEILYGLLIKIVSSKLEFASRDWTDGYWVNPNFSQDITKEESEKVGIRGGLAGQVYGRLSGSEWFNDMARANTAALMRERVYLRAEQNAVSMMILEHKEAQNALLALILNEKNQKEKM